MRKQERYSLVFEKLGELFPQADTELNYNSAFELLVAVILSAQCTDKRVNMVTPALFERYPTVESLVQSSEEEIFSYIKSISYPNAKSKNLKKMAERLHEVYNDEIPSDIEQLQTLAGVGRKTALVMAAVLYKKAVMPVDTHVHRVSARIGLTSDAKNVLDTEKQLLANLKGVDDLALMHHRLILLGRYICKARRPMCENCSLIEECKYYNANIKKKNNK
jgi:endonuclease-3